MNGSEFDFLGPEGRARLSLPLAGRHNIPNALAALAAASVWGVGAAEAREVFPKLEATGMRGRVLHYDAGFTVINDCYNSNPVALAAMVELLANTPATGRHIARGRRNVGAWSGFRRTYIAKPGARRPQTENSTGSSVCRATRKILFAERSKRGIRPRGQNFSHLPRRPARSLAI